MKLLAGPNGQEGEWIQKGTDIDGEASSFDNSVSSVTSLSHDDGLTLLAIGVVNYLIHRSSCT